MKHDDMTKLLLRKYDKAVPRYTSFPTAAQFTPGLSQAAYGRFLGEVQDGETVSLYVHIPFCHSLCHYCGCNTKVVNSYEPVRAYLSVLHQEIALTRAAVKAAPVVTRLHFGGGSPNYLKAEDLESLIEALRARFTFGPEAEIDIECDPRYLDEALIEAYAAMGVTRVSLGVQDFDARVQEAINRVQPFEQVRACVERLRAAGIARINFDLMTGLPLQSLETVARTAELSVSLSPDRLAVFPYAHVPWMKRHQSLLEKFPMPGPQERFAMTELVREKLVAAGYAAIGIDHFARPDDRLALALRNHDLHRNFQGYTDDPSQTILGFGLSAISSFEGAYAQNTTDAPAYRAALAKGEFPVARGCALSEDDIARRDLIQTLMCYGEVDLSIHAGILFSLPRTLPALAVLQQDGLVELGEEYLRITDKGRPFTRVVAACFDPYYEEKPDRHAKAV